MFFSVVVPTFNRRNLLRESLRALQSQQAAEFETIVVDDGSTDGTQEMMTEEFPTVQCLRNDKRGPAAARNRGIQIARGEIIAFTDDDCVVPANWLARLESGYMHYPVAAGVGGSLIAPPEMLKSNVFARYEYFVGHQLLGAGEQEYLGGYEAPGGGTANMSYRRTVLEDVGGFDESFPVAAGEDADLNFRVCARGHRVLYMPIWVTHMQEYSWARFKRQCFVRGVGRNYFEAKHGKGRPSRPKVALRMVRRLLNFPVDLARIPEIRLALLRLADGLITCQGQWVGK